MVQLCLAAEHADEILHALPRREWLSAVPGEKQRIALLITERDPAVPAHCSLDGVPVISVGTAATSRAVSRSPSGGFEEGALAINDHGPGAGDRGD